MIRNRTIAGCIAAAAATAATTFALVSCSGSSTAAPIPLPTASPTPTTPTVVCETDPAPDPAATPGPDGCTPRQEAISQARAAIARFWAVDDKMGANPNLPLSLYDPVGTGQAKDLAARIIKNARKGDYTIQGQAVIIYQNPTAVALDPTPNAPAGSTAVQAVQFQQCTDSSNVRRIKNKTGKDMDPASTDRIDQKIVVYNAKPGDPNGWKVGYVADKATRC